MVLDQAAPLVLAAMQIAVALVLALPAIAFRSLRRSLRLALITAAVVFHPRRRRCHLGDLLLHPRVHPARPARSRAGKTPLTLPARL
jgi:hypothetical protein